MQNVVIEVLLDIQNEISRLELVLRGSDCFEYKNLICERISGLKYAYTQITTRISELKSD